MILALGFLALGVALGIGVMLWYTSIFPGFRMQSEQERIEFQIWKAEKQVELAELRHKENEILERSLSGQAGQVSARS